MNFREILINNAVSNLTANSKAINVEVKSVLQDLATGQYNAQTLPPEKFNILNLASEALNDRRKINQINKGRRGDSTRVS